MKKLKIALIAVGMMLCACVSMAQVKFEKGTVEEAQALAKAQNKFLFTYSYTPK